MALPQDREPNSAVLERPLSANPAPRLGERLGLDGPLNLFNGWPFWTVSGLLLIALLIFPAVGSPFAASNLSSFFLNIPLALGLALLWGFCGVLSFGQMAFFGIAAYSYGVIATNLGGGAWTLPAAGAAIVLAMLVAVAFGYFMFYGRVSDWIVPVLTLVLTLVLETFLAQTAGYQWHIGKALLGGYNGMSNIPSLNIAGVELNGFSFPIYYVIIALVVVIFVALRRLVNAHFGHVLVAIREDPERTELLGYDVRLYRLVVFVIAAGLAGLSGVLYVSWGNYITPSALGLLAATLPVLWVAIGGRSSLAAVVLSTYLLEALKDWLAVYSGEFALVIVGVLLLLGMMFAPQGLVVALAQFVRRLLGVVRD